MLKVACKAASISANERAKVGAAVFQGKHLISIGWNDTRKTHPASPYRFKSIHAEFAALVANHKFDLIGSTIMIARVTEKGVLKIAKPCKHCREIIRAAGVKKVYFTNRQGEIEKLDLSVDAD